MAVLSSLLAIAWPGGASGASVLSHAWWVHQRLSALATLAFVAWLVRLAERRARERAARVVPFPYGTAKIRSSRSL